MLVFAALGLAGMWSFHLLKTSSMEIRILDSNAYFVGHSAIRAEVRNESSSKPRREILIDNRPWKPNGFNWEKWNLENGEIYRVSVVQDEKWSRDPDAKIYRIQKAYHKGRPYQKSLWNKR